MFVDTSALIAILVDEPQVGALAAALEGAQARRTSPLVRLETCAVLATRLDIPLAKAEALFEELIAEAGIADRRRRWEARGRSLRKLWQGPPSRAAQHRRLFLIRRREGARRTAAVEGRRDRAETTLPGVFRKARFWDHHREQPFNDRQRRILDVLLDGFPGASHIVEIRDHHQDVSRHRRP